MADDKNKDATGGQMLGTFVLALFQVLGGGRATLSIMKYFENRGFIVRDNDDPIYLVVFAIIVSIVVWAIGLLGSEIIKDVDKPTKNTLVSAIVITAIIIAMSVIPLFSNYVEPFRLQYLPYFNTDHLLVLGAVLGYHVSR